MKRALLKLTLLAAFDPADMKNALVARTLAEAAAALLRYDGALACASEYELVTETVPDADASNLDALVVVLEKRFPGDGLLVGPLPPTQMLGRNGMLQHARLVRAFNRLELWLGTDNERFPLLEVVTDTTGKRSR